MTTVQRKPIVYDAIQFTGQADVPAVQAFLAPFSPGFGQVGTDAKPMLHVSVRDGESEQKYPGLGVQYQLASVHVGDWILKDEDGAVIVVSAKEFAAGWEVLPGGAITVPMTMDTLVVGVDTLPPHDQVERSPFGLGQPVTATHPRAVGKAHAATHDGRQPDDVDAGEK